MIDRVAIQMVRWVAWALLLAGLVAVLALGALVVNLGGAWFSVWTLAACGIAIGAAFAWAGLLLLAMNADNLVRIREALEAITPQPPP